MPSQLPTTKEASLGIEQYLRHLDRVVARGRPPIRAQGWSRFRPVLATDLALLASTIAGARTVLDVGCGQGLHACFLARHGYGVTGIDDRPGDIAVAAAVAHGLGVHLRFLVSSIESFLSRSDQRFDVVMESAVLPVACRRDIPPDAHLEQLAEGRSFLRAVHDLVCRSGRVFVSVEGGLRIESLSKHLMLLRETGFLIKKIDGPHTVFLREGSVWTWLVTCVAE